MVISGLSMKNPIRLRAPRLPAVVTASTSWESSSSAGNKENHANGASDRNQVVPSSSSISDASRASSLKYMSRSKQTSARTPKRVAQLQSENQRLSGEIAFLQNELSVIVSRNALDKHDFGRDSQELQREIHELEEELAQVKKRAEVKDGAMRVLEKQLRSKNGIICKLRGEVETLIKEKARLEHKQLQQDQMQKEELNVRQLRSMSSLTEKNHRFVSSLTLTDENDQGITNAASRCIEGIPFGTPTKSRATTYKIPSSSGVSGRSSVKSTLPSAAATPPAPFRSPSPNARIAKRSAQRHYLPQATQDSRSDIFRKEDPAKPSAVKTDKLLMEQKKAIDSLKQALVEKTNQCNKIGKDLEEYKVAATQEMKQILFAAKNQPTSAEVPLCDSDEFEPEIHTTDANVDCNYNINIEANVSGIESCEADVSVHGAPGIVTEETFMKKLDNLELDLSHDVANLSALLGNNIAHSSEEEASIFEGLQLEDDEETKYTDATF